MEFKDPPQPTYPKIFPGERVPPIWLYLGATTLLTVLLAAATLLTRYEGFILLLTAGFILYAAFWYPRWVFLTIIAVGTLAEMVTLWRLERLHFGEVLSVTLVTVVLVALGFWARSLNASLDLTRRELRESEERYRTFVQRFQGIALKGKLSGKLVFIHGAVEEITGYHPDDFYSGRVHWPEIVHPDDKPAFNEVMNRGKQIAGFTCKSDYRIVRKDGGVRWMSDAITILADQNGRPEFFQVTLSDITARKLTEEALRESDTRYRALFEAMQEGFALFEPIRDPAPTAAGESAAVVGYRVVAANPAFEAALRLEPGRAMGARLASLFPGIWPGLLNAFEEALNSGQPQQVETFLVKNNVHLQLRFYQPASGHVAMLLSDISERKGIEAALQESRAHFRTLFDNSPVALWDEDFSQIKRMVDECKSRGINDLRGYLRGRPAEVERFIQAVILRDVNQAAVRLMGVSDRAALVGNLSVALRSPYHDSIIEEVQAIAEGLTKFEWEGLNDVLDGEPRAHRIVWSVAPGSEKTYARVIVAIEDVTGRKRAEEALVHLSSHDALTGLHNRTYFDAEMERLSISRLYPITIFFADIDGLKVINDTLGHHVGDELLRRATRVLRQAFRAEDIVARIGGDEIGILLPQAGDEVAAEALKRVEQLRDAENAVNPNPPVAFSIGFATAQKGDNLHETLRLADEAMYRAKRVRREG